ncbi:MAG: hypothetical protein PVF91_15585, partial [Chromatiales bacterium]
MPAPKAGGGGSLVQIPPQSSHRSKKVHPRHELARPAGKRTGLSAPCLTISRGRGLVDKVEALAALHEQY